MLSVDGSEGERDAAPRIEVGCGARQMHDDSADGADDVHAELESRSLSHGTWVRAHAVRAVHRRSSCRNT